jgi:CRP-like cAMP-binding protein
MALSPEQAASAWDLFGNTPLFSAWADARDFLMPRLEVRDLRAGARVFEAGDSPEYLYLVGSGLIRETVRRDNALSGPVWLELAHAPGQHFGQKALFSGLHDSTAVAAQDSTLFLMGPIDLRMAMEHNPDLRDFLLRENLSSRLRRIPLLSSLEDDEILWLAKAFAEASYGSGVELPLQEKLGLWIIEWGHVGVTGPADLREVAPRAGEDQAARGTPTSAPGEPWRLTAGNFFVSLDPDRPGPTACAAVTAKAELETRILYLEAGHLRRLAAVFGGVRGRLANPLDIAGVLKGVRDKEQAQLAVVETLMATGVLQAFEPRRLLTGPEMDDEHFEHLAQFCGWEFVPAGQNITTQGATGHSFVVLCDGGAIVHAVDEGGRQRPRNALEPGDYYGQTSLLEGRPRDASVRAVKTAEQGTRSGPGGAEVIVLDRRDLQYAFSERPDLWHPGLPLFDRSRKIREEKRAYEWQDEGEKVLWHDRAHWLYLLLPELGAAAVFAVLYVLLLLVRTAAVQAQLLPEFTTTAWLLAIAWGVTGTIIAINYFIDYYVVTNVRVTHRDRQLLVYDVRTEAPIDMVQDVSIAQLLIGRIFNFGDLTVRTAAKVGGVLFLHTPDPNRVQELILTEHARALAAKRGQQKEVLRRQLIGGLHVALPILERTRALGPRAPSQEQQRPSIHLPRWEWGTPRGYVREAGHYVWRKTWVNLLQRAGLPALFCLILVFILIIGIREGLFSSGALGLPGSSLVLLWLFLFVPTAFWLWYQVMDWRNDIYVVTDDKLIDIEARPLALSYQRREGSLDRVQTAYAEQKGFWANVLDYGTVQILTAAADPGFTFYMVGHPRRVQAIIFQKLDAFRRRQEAERTREGQRQLIEGLEAYHELQHGL